MKRHKPAFTLLELLTVIAILGLLISILVPSLSAARRSAKANACISHLKGIGQGLAIYLNENDDRFPPFRLEKLWPTAETYYVNEFKSQRPRWQWFIPTSFGPVISPRPFELSIRQVGYFHDDTRPRAGNVRNARTMAHDTFTCPTLDDEEFTLDIRDGAFGYNYQYLGNTRQDARPGRWDNFAVGLHQIRSLTGTVVAADSRGAGIRHGRHSYTLDPPRLATERNARRFGPNPDPLSEEQDGGDVPAGLEKTVFGYSPAEPRHHGRANVLFGDTHAEARTLVELGYQMAEKTETGPPKGTPLPIHDPDAGPYTASNKLWNGEGVDPIAEKHRPQGDGG